MARKVKAKNKKVGQPHKKPGDSVQSRMLTDMHFYFVRTDWAELWSKWYLSSDANSAGWKYYRLWDFVKDVSESPEQRDFLHWYLGPVDEEWEKAPEAKRYRFITQGPAGWVKRRNEMGWYNEPNTEAISQELRRRFNSFDKLMATSAYAQVFLDRAVKLSERLDKEFRYAFFVPGISAKDNIDRAKDYLSLHAKIQEYFAAAHDRFAKSLGINFDNMAGLMQIVEATAAAAQSKASEGKQLNESEKAISSLVKMTLEKFGRHNIDLLPSGAAEKIIDAVAVPVPEKAKKVN